MEAPHKRARPNPPSISIDAVQHNTSNIINSNIIDTCTSTCTSSHDDSGSMMPSDEAAVDTPSTEHDNSNATASINDDYFSKYPVLPWIISAIKERPKSQRVTIQMIADCIYEKHFKDNPTDNNSININSNNMNDNESIINIDATVSSSSSSGSMTMEEVVMMVEAVLVSAVRLGCINQYIGEFYRVTNKAETFHRSKEAMTEKQAETLLRHRRDTRIYEGWLYAPVYSNYIGMRIRRFFKGLGASEGVIDSYLPAELNDGIPLWHVLHDDNDDEDLDFDDMIKSRAYHLHDAKHGSDNEIDEADEDDKDDDAEDKNSDMKSSSVSRQVKKRSYPPSQHKYAHAPTKSSTSSKKPFSSSSSTSADNHYEEEVNVKTRNGNRASSRILDNPKYTMMSYHEDALLAKATGTNTSSSRSSSSYNSSNSLRHNSNHSSSNSRPNHHRGACGRLGPYLNENAFDESEEEFDDDFLADKLPELEPTQPSSAAAALSYEQDIIYRSSSDIMDDVKMLAMYHELRCQYQFLPGKIMLANMKVNDRLTRTFICCLPRDHDHMSSSTSSSSSSSSIVPVYVPLFNQIIDLDIISSYADVHDDDFFYNTYYHAYHHLSYDDHLSDRQQHVRDMMKQRWLASMQMQWNYDLVVEMISQRMRYKEEVLQSYYTSTLLQTHKSMREFIRFYHDHLLPIRDGTMLHYTMLLRLYACADLIFNPPSSLSSAHSISSCDGMHKMVIDQIQALVASSQVVIGITIIVPGSDKPQPIGNMSTFTAKYIDSLFDRGKFFSIYPIIEATEPESNLIAADSSNNINPNPQQAMEVVETVIEPPGNSNARPSASSSTSTSSKNRNKRSSSSKVDLSSINIDTHAVLQYDLSSGTILRRYTDRHIAAKLMKYTSADIHRACANHRAIKPMAFGWRFDQNENSAIISSPPLTIRQLLILRQYDRVIDTYRRFNTIPGRIDELEQWTLRSDDTMRIALINLTHLRIIYHYHDHAASSSWFSYHDLLEPLSQPVTMAMVKRCESEWSQAIPSEVSSCIPDADDIYLALQISVERKLLRRSSMMPLYYRLTPTNAPEPLSSSTMISSSGMDSSSYEMMSKALVEIVYMMHVDGIRPSTIYDHFLILYPSAAGLPVSLIPSSPSSSSSSTPRMMMPLMSCELFEEILADNIQAGYLIYDPIDTKNRVSITEFGLNLLFASFNDAQTKSSSSCPRLADHIMDVLSRGYNHLSEATTQPLPTASTSTVPTSSVPLIYHMKQLLIWVSIEKVINAVEVKRSHAYNNISMPGIDASTSQRCDARAVRKVILDWHYARQRDLLDKQSSISTHLLLLFIQNLLQEAVAKERIKYDDKTKSYISIPAHTSSAADRIRDMDILEQHHHQTSSSSSIDHYIQSNSTHTSHHTNASQSIIRDDSGRDTGTSSSSSAAAVQVINKNTVLIKMRNMRFMISEALMSKRGNAGSKVAEIVDYIMNMPLLKQICQVPLRSSSLVQPVTESLIKGTQKGIYTFINREKRYLLAPAERIRIHRRLEVAELLSDMVDDVTLIG